MKTLAIILIIDFWADDSLSISSGPAAYPQAPTYCNTVEMGNIRSDDPFDTSNLDTKFYQYKEYTSFTQSSSVPFTVNAAKPYMDTKKRDVGIPAKGLLNDNQQKENLHVSRTLNQAIRTNSSNTLEQNDQPVIVDDNFIKELERSLIIGKNTESCNIPALDPPPQSHKNRNSDLKNSYEYDKNVNSLMNGKKTNYAHTNNLVEERTTAKHLPSNYDKNTNTTIVNKIWPDPTVKNDTHMYGTTKSCNLGESRDKSSLNNLQNASVINQNRSEFGEFRSNRAPLTQFDPIYSPQRTNIEASIYQNDIYSKTMDSLEKNTLYNNTNVHNTQNGSQNVTKTFNSNSSTSQTYYSVCNSQNSVGPVYSGLPNQRLYSEVDDNVYSEIPENIYSSVPDEPLRPHRPAPPSPLVLVGQPLSMQQIQRKIQQGQVGFQIIDNDECSTNEMVLVKCRCGKAHDARI